MIGVDIGGSYIYCVVINMKMGVLFEDIWVYVKVNNKLFKLEIFN